MKKLCSVTFFISLLYLFTSCKKDPVPVLPVVSTSSISAISYTSAVSGGNVTDEGSDHVTARGLCWGQTEAPTIAGSKTTDSEGAGRYTSSMTGLLPETTYYLRAYATNSAGTGYGEQVSLTTLRSLPLITTAAVTSINGTICTCGGNVTAEGEHPVTARGVCWSTTPDPVIPGNQTVNGTGAGVYSSFLTSLTEGETYYLRAYATSLSGTAYGEQQTFQAVQPQPVTDIEGNVYPAVNIGYQTWMAENLKVTKYRNNDPIAPVTGELEWRNLSSGAYCNYANNSSNGNVYGRLYNWHAVMDSRSICPAGWHVPSESEWVTLNNYLDNNGYRYKNHENEIAKSLAASSGWTTFPVTGTVGNDQTINNKSGFKGLPGGYRSSQGAFYQISNEGYWWSSSIAELNPSSSVLRMLSYGGTQLTRAFLEPTAGASVRCIKNN